MDREPHPALGTRAVPRLAVCAVLLLLVEPAMPMAGTLPGDPVPSVSIHDARVPEGDSGYSALQFRLSLSSAADSMVSVHFETEDGTATVADSDYVATAGDIEFAPGDTFAVVTIAVRGDTIFEGNEWLRMKLSNPQGLTIERGAAYGFILNDERTTFEPFDGQFTQYIAGTVPPAWGDYNNDGYPDLAMYRGGPNGVFEEIPGFRDILADGNYHGIAWCDFDRDGDLDVVLVGYTGIDGGEPTPTRLLRNDGEAGFTDIAPSQGMDIVASGETAVWADFDGDGWPDLFVPYYSFTYPFQSFLYHNNGDGTFTDVAAPAGVSLALIPAALRPEGAQAADWNGDGYLDLYAASHLFLNDGAGHFTDVREAVGLPIVFDEGANFVDYDNDGDLDLYVRGEDGPHLFRNDDGHFTEVTEQAGLHADELDWGDTWVDVDDDGDLDLLLQVNLKNSCLMLNQGDGTFVRDTVFDALEPTAGLAAWADFDNDGDPDVVIGSGWYHEIYRNRLESRPGVAGSTLEVVVLDDQGHQTQYGATVRLREVGGPPNVAQVRVVDGGSGYLSQNEYPVRFGGLGQGRYALEVVFPSPAGTRVVVDSLVNPLLGSIVPKTMVRPILVVRRGGAVEIADHGVAAVAAAAPAPEHAVRFGNPYPAPARKSVTIPLTLSRPARVSLSIHDLSGRLVRRLGTLDLQPGEHSVKWDLADDRGASTPAGLYFCEFLIEGRRADVRRVLVLR
jgi:hypothetical protein